MDKSEQLRHLQLTQLLILKKVVNVCDKHKLQYFLHYGSLLGAVRHNGFIPWDDDVDMAMKRTDYERFLKIAQTELGNEFFVQHYTTDNNYSRYIIKVRLNGTTHLEYGVEDVVMNHGIYIDIFPLDKVPNTKGIILSARKKIIKVSRHLLAIKKGVKEKCSRIRCKIKAVFRPLLMLIPDRCYYWVIEATCNLTSKKSGENWACFVGAYGIQKEIILDNHLGEGTLCKFEDAKFRVPSKSHMVLSNLYGEYLKIPPIEKQVVHDIVKLDFGKYS